LREGCRLAEVSVVRALLGADGGGAGAGAAFICELLPAGGGCDALDLLALDFATLAGGFEFVLIEVVVVEAVRVVAFAADDCAGVEFPAGADFLAMVAVGFTGAGTVAGAGAAATEGVLDTPPAGARSSAAVDNTISTGASAAAAARALAAAFAALTAAAAGRVYAGATVAVGAGAVADEGAA
jgi:hypothetical protein